MIHRAKGFGIVNKTEVDVFLELSCFFCDPKDVDNLISDFSAFSKSSLNIWKFSLQNWSNILSKNERIGMLFFSELKDLSSDWQQLTSQKESQPDSIWFLLEAHKPPMKYIRSYLKV